MADRIHFVNTRLTDGEYRQVKALCDKTGLSASEVIRSALAGVELRERPPADLATLYTEINRIGNNINQIARKMNSGLGTKADVQDVLYLLRKVYEKMEAVADG